MVKEEKTVLVVGGDGMAGHMLTLFLREQGYVVHNTSRRNYDDTVCHYFDVVLDYHHIENIIKKVKPDFVVNCIGALNQFAENNKDQAVLLNSFLPHYLDTLSQKHAFKFVHISTDCVFSGSKGGYQESDTPDADSFYGRSKSLGEIINDRSVTFRTSIVGPDINENGIGLFHWFMNQEKEVSGYTKVIWSGVTTLQLAKTIEQSFHVDITGLYHVVNNEKIDKYNLLVLFKDAMKKNIVILENPDVINDKSILNSRKDFDFHVPSYKVMIDEMAEWIFDHRDMYQTTLLNAQK